MPVERPSATTTAQQLGSPAQAPARAASDTAQTQVRFFAHVAATLQRQSMALDQLNPCPATVADLRHALAAHFPEIASQLAACRIATNTAFLRDDDALPRTRTWPSSRR